MNIQPFKLNISQATLDDLRERLARTRWPDEVEEAGWDYGTNQDYLKSLAAYWQHQLPKARVPQRTRWLLAQDGRYLPGSGAQSCAA